MAELVLPVGLSAAFVGDCKVSTPDMRVFFDDAGFDLPRYSTTSSNCVSEKPGRSRRVYVIVTSLFFYSNMIRHPGTYESMELF